MRTLPFILTVLANILTFLFCPLAHAVHRPRDFSGLSASLGTYFDLRQVQDTATYQYENIYSDVLRSQEGGSFSLASPPTHSVIPSLGLNYTAAFNNRWMVGLVGSLDLGRSQNTQLSSQGTLSDVLRYYLDASSGPASFSPLGLVENRFHWSVGLEGGYIASDDIPMYAKITYHHLVQEITTNLLYTTYTPDLRYTLESLSPQQKGFQGLGFSLGFRQPMARYRWFIQPEIEYIVYETHRFKGPTLQSIDQKTTLWHQQKIQDNRFVLKLSIGYWF